MKNATPAISLRRFGQPASRRVEIVEGATDRFVLSLPLCRGRVTLRCDGGTIYDGDVRPGMLRITAPGERVRVLQRSAAQALVLSIPAPLVQQLAADHHYHRSASALTYVSPIVNADPQVERLTSLLLGAPDIDTCQRPLFLHGLTLALLAIAFEPRASARRQPGLSDTDFARCIDYADAHLCEKVDIASWAASLGLPLAEFIRRFQQTTHMAPYGWLLNWRIDRAKAMLDDPETTLAEIAFRVGFSSQSHFTEAFRRRTGVSPGRWRKNRPGFR